MKIDSPEACIELASKLTTLLYKLEDERQSLLGLPISNVRKESLTDTPENTLETCRSFAEDIRNLKASISELKLEKAYAELQSIHDEFFGEDDET